MRSLTAFSMIVAGLSPFGARAADEPRSSRKRRASAWTVSFLNFDIVGGIAGEEQFGNSGTMTSGWISQLQLESRLKAPRFRRPGCDKIVAGSTSGGRILADHRP